MDDDLEKPSSDPVSAAVQEAEEDEHSSGDEDGGLDWTKIMPTVARPVIPKRGEKEFEPVPGGGSGLQQHVLGRSRSAMFDTLRATRSTSSKSLSHAIWYPDIARAHVIVARGIHFTSMGHSVPRPLQTEPDGPSKVQKRLELLPEETIYLIERGALFCWKDHHRSDEFGGPQMSVQQSFSEMIGTEDLTLEKYQVYAYLKRLGYVVTRTDPPTTSYPTPQPLAAVRTRHQSALAIVHRLSSLLPALFFKLIGRFYRPFNWWKPVHISRYLHHNKTYASIFQSLRFIPTGHQIPLCVQPPREARSSPYKIFFNVYKPATPFRKSAPPAPDFSIVVVNARTTPMPSLHELTSLFDVLPEMPPPLPRQRPRPPQHVPSASTTANSDPRSANISILQRLFPWAFSNPPVPDEPRRRPNPFAALKAGKKVVVIAVVDAGSISFFRFCQGAFSEWPMA